MQLHDRLSTSAAFAGLLLLLFGTAGAAFAAGSPAFSRLLRAFILNFPGRFFLFFHSATGAAFFRPSAACGSGLFHLSTAGARLGPSAAPGMGAGYGDPSHAQQTGDTEAGKIPFQLFSIHADPPDGWCFMRQASIKTIGTTKMNTNYLSVFRRRVK
jgi:hypothetical protein